MYFLDIFLDKEIGKDENVDERYRDDTKLDESLFIKINMLYDNFLASIE